MKKSISGLNPIIYIAMMVMCIFQVYQFRSLCNAGHEMQDNGRVDSFSNEVASTQNQSVDENLMTDTDQPEQSNEFVPTRNQRENLTCDQMQKYILLTEQRSGSTWTCTTLKQQDDISCGAGTSEMMIDYSAKLKDKTVEVTWDEWTADMDKVFQKLCDEKPAPAIGFKLMADQIPNQYKFDGHLEKYLSDNNIAVLQLVREAVVLRAASVHDAVQERRISSSSAKAHVKSVEELKEIPKDIEQMSWTKGQVDQAVSWEEENKKWQRALHFMPDVRHYYLSYEHLLTKKGLEDNLSRIISFLMPFPTYGVKVNMDSTTLRLHSPLCSSRIKDFDEFAKKLEEAGAVNTVAACRMVETLSYEKYE